MAAADQSYCDVQLDAEESYCGEFRKERCTGRRAEFGDSEQK